MIRDFHIDVSCQQTFCDGQRVCGDVFQTRKIVEEERILLILADGMGHGIKANMLGTLTATMAINFAKEHKEINRIAEIVLHTLPVTHEKKAGYSTFTIVDIEANGLTSILEYENPKTIILRGKEPFLPEWNCVLFDSKALYGRELVSCTFQAQKEDRIVFFTDGVTQSGMGSANFPIGWGIENSESLITGLVSKNPIISARHLANRVIAEALKNDGYHATDDTSCAVIYFREPRKILIATGPPSDAGKDSEMARQVKEFKGKKIVSGATTGDIISRELGLAVAEGQVQTDPELPPVSLMQDIDVYTEGILTLSKVNRILRVYNNSYILGKGPADQIVRMLLESDDINFLIGTRINEAHQDPNIPVELEIRRTVVSRVARLLEENFLKTVTIRYI